MQTKQIQGPKVIMGCATCGKRLSIPAMTFVEIDCDQELQCIPCLEASTDSSDVMIMGNRDEIKIRHPREVN